VTAPLLLDASVWLAALDEDDRHHGAARKLIEAAADGRVALAALDLTLYEVANVAVVRWQSPKDAGRLVELVQNACGELVEAVSADLLEEAAAVAASEQLSVYDGAYVVAARRNGWTLVSGDERDLVRPGLAIAPDAPGY
jgi:predicted nucleic acid-binding protein